LRICIDATPIGVKTTDKGGVCRYISELIESLSSIDSTNQYTLFFNFFRRKHIPVLQEVVKRLRIGENFRIRLSRFPPRLRSIKEPPIELLAGKFDVFHNGFDYLPPILLGKGIATIHDVRYLEDMKHETKPEWIETLKRVAPIPEFYIRDYLARGKLFNRLRSTIRKTIRRAAAIITVSEFCKSRITEILRISPEKIHVIYHGIDIRFKPLTGDEITHVLQKYRIRRPYILYTGRFDPLKNPILLLEAFKKVITSHDLTLVMAGPFNWFFYIVMEQARQLGIIDRVVFTDFVTDDELVALYSGASAFCFPSLYEGFGMPVLEAMACGSPVICSDVCSLPEIAGDAALYVNPSSSNRLAEAILNVLLDKGLREQLIQKGFERVKAFTWRKAAGQTLDIYNKVNIQ